MNWWVFFKLSHSTLSIIIDKKTNDYHKNAKYICSLASSELFTVPLLGGFPATPYTTKQTAKIIFANILEKNYKLSLPISIAISQLTVMCLLQFKMVINESLSIHPKGKPY